MKCIKVIQQRVNLIMSLTKLQMQKMVNVCCPLGCSDNRAIQEQLPGSSWANLKPKLTKKIKQTAEDKLIKNSPNSCVPGSCVKFKLTLSKTK